MKEDSAEDSDGAIPHEGNGAILGLRPKMFLEIPTAAGMAGFSVRHFRRIIEEEGIRIVQIGRKFFILGEEFRRWESGRKSCATDFSRNNQVVVVPASVGAAPEPDERQMLAQIIQSSETLIKAAEAREVTVPEFLSRCRRYNLVQDLQRFFK